MQTNIQKLKNNIVSGKNRMESISIKLKNEFFGIDDVIDQIIDAISPWYLFPQAQEIPLVVSLFGMTGVGKTSLVERIVELLGFENRYYRLDSDFYKGNYSKSFEAFQELFTLNEKLPIILALDEFQHARSINSSGNEISGLRSSFVWDLLDSKKISKPDYNYMLDDFKELIDKLEFFLFKGVKVKNGLVYTKKGFWLEYMHEIKKQKRTSKRINNDFDEDNFHFVGSSNYDIILTAFKDRFKSCFEIKEYLRTLDGPQIISFLKSAFQELKKPQLIDCSKSLIFILGNIDEAFNMHGNMNPDINADEFYNMCKKINITHVKNALRERFRSEQIARLGNNMIVYPSLNCFAYKCILEKELAKIIARMKEMYGLEIHFDEALKQLIYDEGVYPTQGARPLISSISHIVKSNLSFMMLGLIEKRGIKKVNISVCNQEIVFTYYNAKNKTHETKRKIALKLNQLRQPKKDDMQSIVAVHESGHAVVGGILLKVIPNAMYSQMASADQSGLVISKIPWQYIAKKELLLRLAVYLGGFAAEKIVFGEERITTGSESDISNATGFVCDMLKSSGMAGLPAKYSVEDFRTNLCLFDDEKEINQMAKTYIRQALDLAEKTLQENEVLLLMLADKLSDCSRLNHSEIKDMFLTHAPSISENAYITEGNNLFYREALKNKIKKLHEQTDLKVETESYVFSLNKDKNG